MSCIVLVGGGIGCGKSTLIKYFLEHEMELFAPNIYEDGEEKELKNVSAESPNKLRSMFFVIQFDNLCSIKEQEQLMKTLHGWKNFRINLLMAAERLISIVCESENSLAGPLSEKSQKLLDKLSSSNSICNNISKAVIIVEDNFYYRSMRYEWLQIARRNNLGFATIFLHCLPSIAVYRNSTRGYHIPEEKLKRMLFSIEYPNPIKFKWEKYSQMFDSSSELTHYTLIHAVDVIKEAIKHPAEHVIFEDKIEAQKICSKSAIHQADNILRRILSKKISELKALNTDECRLKYVASNLVNVRQKLLLDIKHDVIHLPQELVVKIQNLGIECVLDDYEECLEDLFNRTLEEIPNDVIVSLNNLQIKD